MAYSDLNPKLKDALLRLDAILNLKGAKLTLLLGGASAMKIMDITPRDSKDIDNLRSLEYEVKLDIQKVGREFNIEEDWLNDQASDIPLPDGAEDRIVEVDAGLKVIRVYCLSRKDLIAMKVNAAVTRSDERDFIDIKNSNVTLDEFLFAVDYITKKQRPDDEEFCRYQDEDIAELRKGLFGK